MSRPSPPSDSRLASGRPLGLEHANLRTKGAECGARVIGTFDRSADRRLGYTIMAGTSRSKETDVRPCRHSDQP